MEEGRFRLDDFELYQLLFWNHSLTPDELCLFGEQLAKEFPILAYETFMFLAKVFEVTHSMIDNHERAFHYYKKAASGHPEKSEPYMNAAECYEPDLNIPPLSAIIDFFKKGAQHATKPKIFYRKLAEYYDILGNDEMRNYYRRLSEEGPPPQQDSPQS